ncbi:two-component system, NtrC family, C4-dicarboxylate transport response regulator DctD [Maridesulfovibrio ferrireducens]|uniref:Two-component system, NtrC family, C4-dicarboxylate transport response regulator DctD n=1 Tax=Maridesulfovibrio ferrireducens TaxID=246191 RepID=A0A1G9LRE7_9BACT|nr:sigma-54 dependent transcriptional regulator [Maridesulfovibrio ferrireducens]SDL64530.1 two-component system, NtrC family, C4-dicarboxylate transport response regulator DctD [Maridesulfovibrio ferrireducens]
MTDVIIIDDERTVRESAQQWLELSGLSVRVYSDAKEALAYIDSDFSGVVVSDVKMSGIDGLALQKKIFELDPGIPVVLFTGHGDIAMAVTAIRDGAYDFVEKPFDPERMLEIIKRAMEKRQLVLENRDLRREMQNSRGMESKLIGTSKKMRELKREIANIAPTAANVLISGATGTGKEVVARSIHALSMTGRGPYIALNCAAIPVSMAESELFGHCSGAFTSAQGDRIGKLEAANGGTLFLDEVNSMPLDVQGKLLRALECKEITPLGSNKAKHVEFRLISAMNEDPQEAVRNGKLREDLLFRLNTVELVVPPLRERRDDISMLFSFFMERAAETWDKPVEPLPSESLAVLMGYSWPGNVRELKNIAERYVLSALPPRERIPKLLSSSSEDRGDSAVPLKDQVNLFERNLIKESLLSHKGNIKAVLAELMIPRRTLNEKMSKFNLKRLYKSSRSG